MRAPLSPLPLLSLVSVLAAPALARAQAVTYVNDPLTAAPTRGAVAGVTAGFRGGTFTSEGWRTTGGTDTVWFVIPASLPRGRVEFTVRGLSTMTTLVGQEHDIVGIYGSPERAEPVPYNPWFRNNTFKVLVRIFGAMNVCSGCQAVGASKLELALCPAGPPGYIEDPCPAACVAMGYDFWQAYLGPRGRGEELPWDASTAYRMSIVWEPGRMTYSRGGPEGSSTLTYPGTFAPRELRVRLGPPSSERGPDTILPVGLTFSNLLVQGEPGAPTPFCGGGAMDAGVAPDAAVGADGGMDGATGCAARPISVAMFEPATGAGRSQVFRAVYRHCFGARTFRVAQVWVGASVTPDVPSVSAGYEGGRFYVGDGAVSCAPGESRRLSAGRYGAIDCARSRAVPSGNDLVVDWALEFDPATFAGEQGVFVDAKGGAGTPEPRLGWTRVGTFTVNATGGMDAGAGGDAGASADAGGGDDAGAGGGTDAGARADAGRTSGGMVRGGCGCATQGRARGLPAGAAIVLAAVTAAGRRRGRRRGQPRADGAGRGAA